MAERQGWRFSLTAVSAILVLLAWFDRCIYRVCPFCAAHVHTDKERRRATTLSWPLLIVGCIHSAFDGLTIALPRIVSASTAAAAVSWGITVHKIPESVAIGILAARLTSRKILALASVGFIQAALGLGCILPFAVGGLNPRWSGLSAVPACAILLLSGILAVREESRLRGYAAAIRAAIPALLGSGLGALAAGILPR